MGLSTFDHTHKDKSMPMTSIRLPARAVTAVRLVCTHCGAAASIPLAATRAPEKCFNCLRPLPGGPLLTLVRELAWLREASGVEAGFEADIEGELEREV